MHSSRSAHAPPQTLSLHGHEPRVEAACGNELGMRAHLNDAAAIEHGDLVGVRHGAQAMRYDEH